MIQNYCPNFSLKALVLALAFLLACLNHWIPLSLTKLVIRTTSHFSIWQTARCGTQLATLQLFVREGGEAVKGYFECFLKGGEETVRQ